MAAQPFAANSTNYPTNHPMLLRDQDVTAVYSAESQIRYSQYYNDQQIPQAQLPNPHRQYTPLNPAAGNRPFPQNDYWRNEWSSCQPCYSGDAGASAPPAYGVNTVQIARPPVTNYQATEWGWYHSPAALEENNFNMSESHLNNMISTGDGFYAANNGSMMNTFQHPDESYDGSLTELTNLGNSRVVEGDPRDQQADNGEQMSSAYIADCGSNTVKDINAMMQNEIAELELVQSTPQTRYIGSARATQPSPNDESEKSSEENCPLSGKSAIADQKQDGNNDEGKCTPVCDRYSRNLTGAVTLFR